MLISENDIYGQTFGCIHQILCCKGQKLFVLDVMVTELFNEKFNSYEVSFRRGNVEVKEYTDFTYKWPLPVYSTDNGNLLIMNRATTTVLLYWNYLWTCIQSWGIKLIFFVVYTENMVWFRIQSKDGKKMIICNPAELDAAIMKGILVCKWLFHMHAKQKKCTSMHNGVHGQTFFLMLSTHRMWMAWSGKD